jgi:hypothetical protein
VFRIAPPPTSGDQHRWYLLGVRDTETELLGWVRDDQALLVRTALLPTEPTRALPIGAPHAQKRGINMPSASASEPMLAIEPAAVRWLTSLARDFCAEATNDFALDILRRGIEIRTGFDGRDSSASSAALLMSMFGLPREAIPALYFSSWDDLATRHRHMTKSERENFKTRVCAKANVLRDAQTANPALGLALVKIPLSVLN